VPPSLPPTEAVRPGLWSIAVPFPNNPLGYTLVYLLESDRGPVLVDAGWDDDESWDALVAGFRDAGSDVSACYGVLVTHVHPDHHGLSGRVREASDAWVAMHERDSVTIDHISKGMADEHAREQAPTRASRDFDDELAAVLLDAGATEDELAAAPTPTYPRRERRFRPLAAPDRAVGDGEQVDVPGWDVRAIWTPGHTPGHLCFHVPEHRMLLSGDHVLPSITPHISISRRDRGGDPLGDFLDSLQKVAGLDADEVLPADGPASLWQVAARLTWNRPWDQFPLGLRRSAVNETAAHLRYLTRRDRAVRLKGVRPYTFALPEGVPA
jgi:glyoxylase-like metal-dependent hydrolase (beta-lactamase superfamily II)